MSEFWQRRLDHARQQEEVAWARVADLEAENERLRAENADLTEANQRLRRQYENLRES